MGVGAALGAPVVLLYALDSLLTKLIIFYQDRVVKIWNFLGQETIYYSKAKVSGAPRNWQIQRLNWYQITETKHNGRSLLFQIPIIYGAYFVPPDAAKKIDWIIDYLTGKNEKTHRMFKESFLPMDVVCRPNATEK